MQTHQNLEYIYMVIQDHVYPQKEEYQHQPNSIVEDNILLQDLACTIVIEWEKNNRTEL